MIEHEEYEEDLFDYDNAVLELKKALFRQFCVLMTLVLIVTGCSKTKDVSHHGEALSERYRSMVLSDFQNRARHYNADTRYLIIVDYGIPSNKDRLFIWDTEQDKIVEKFWCAHGFGGGSTAESPVFSNTLGSNCSSLGWFLIDRSVGIGSTYGYKYHAVDGLDASNSNARRRQILIHPWSSVSNDEAAKIDHPMQLDYRCAGCFTISDNAYQTIDRYIKSRNKRILLWAINGVAEFN